MFPSRCLSLKYVKINGAYETRMYFIIVSNWEKWEFKRSYRKYVIALLFKCCFIFYAAQPAAAANLQKAVRW